MQLVSLALLGACSGGLTVIDTDSDDPDAIDTDTDPDVVDTDVIGPSDPVETLLLEGIENPVAWYTRVRTFAQGSGSCPSTADVDAQNTTVAGGCTDSGGVVWAGSANFRHLDAGDRIDFDGFGADGVLLSGQILVTGDVLTADYDGRDEAGALLFAHDAHAFTPAGSAQTVIAGGAGTYTIGGRLTLADIGVFTLSGEVSRDGACDQEPDQGDLEATGPQTYDFDINGGAICDGCVSWDGSTGAGEVCPWL